MYPFSPFIIYKYLISLTGILQEETRKGKEKEKEKKSASAKSICPRREPHTQRRGADLTGTEKPGPISCATIIIMIIIIIIIKPPTHAHFPARTMTPPLPQQTKG